MIDYTILPAFMFAVFFLVISPGPDLLLISSYSSTKGFKSGAFVAIGVFIAGVAQTILVAIGLGKLMQAIPLIALTIKIVGALYLTYLGLTLIRAWLSERAKGSDLTQPKHVTNTQLITQGLFNNLMNPKALLFFSLFIPQFTSEQIPLIPQIMLLGLLLCIFALLVNLLFAFSFSKLGASMSCNTKVAKHIDGILGVIFIGLATRLVTSK